MDTTVVLGLTALSYGLALGYLLRVVLRKPRQERGYAWLRFAFLMTCPVAGGCYLLLSRLLSRLFFTRADSFVVQKEAPAEARVLAVLDENAELNVVSIEEAMIVSHRSDLRRLLLNILKDGADNSLDAIALALESDDSEASHYSASAIADSLARFHDRLRELDERYEQTDDPDALREIVEHLLWYLEKNLLSEREQSMYLQQASERLLQLADASAEEAISLYYSRLVALAVRAEDLELANAWADRLALRFPDTRYAYTANLQCRYACGDAEGFSQWLGRLKRSKVVINKETLDLIRTLG